MYRVYRCSFHKRNARPNGLFARVVNFITCLELTEIFPALCPQLGRITNNKSNNKECVLKCKKQVKSDGCTVPVPLPLFFCLAIALPLPFSFLSPFFPYIAAVSLIKGLQGLVMVNRLGGVSRTFDVIINTYKTNTVAADRNTCS